MLSIVYLGMLLLFTAQAQTAPSSVHSHLQRHRARTATHAHLSHQHAKLIKQAEVIKMKPLQAAEPATQQELAEEKPSTPSSHGETPLWPPQYEDGPGTVTTDAEEPSQQEKNVMASREQLRPERFRLVMRHGDGSSKPVADSIDSRHADTARRMLRAHAIVKHNKFQREV